MRTESLGATGLTALVAMAFVFAPGTAEGCSCWETADIGTVLTRSDIVVVGEIVRRVETREDFDDESSGLSAIPSLYDYPVVVKVVNALKGEVGKEILVSTDLMCFRSFNVDDFKVGESFVFPVDHKSGGLHILPSCAHSALKLID